MAPFGEADSERFYGRTVEVEAAERSLRLVPWLAVVGPSGSGKSSLVLAGLVPRLRATGHEIAVLRPGDRPLESLRQLRGRVGTGGGRHLVVVIDQLEALFTLATDQVRGFCEELET
jgi:molybdopterin-guanine dinucleotide biosynthesis protein